MNCLASISDGQQSPIVVAWDLKGILPRDNLLSIFRPSYVGWRPASYRLLGIVFYKSSYNRSDPARALIGQKPMFYQSIKHRNSVFNCFSLHNFYIIEQMKKPKPCITL